MTVFIKVHKEAVLTCPAFLKPYKQYSPDTICIDVEIVNVLKALWSHGIITLGCCSGHGKTFPTVIISDRYKKETIKEIKNIIYSVDKRRLWLILFGKAEKNEHKKVRKTKV